MPQLREEHKGLGPGVENDDVLHRAIVRALPLDLGLPDKVLLEATDVQAGESEAAGPAWEGRVQAQRLSLGDGPFLSCMESNPERRLHALL